MDSFSDASVNLSNLLGSVHHEAKSLKRRRHYTATCTTPTRLRQSVLLIFHILSLTDCSRFVCVVDSPVPAVYSFLFTFLKGCSDLATAA